MKILVLGYGNPGRADDALGPLLVEELERRRAISREPALAARSAGALRSEAEGFGAEPSFAAPALVAQRDAAGAASRAALPRVLPRVARGGTGARGEQSAPQGPAHEVDLAWSYELSADHAYDLARHELILFVDAARRQAEPVHLRTVHPSRSITFSTHAMTPASVLALAGELYGAKPEVHLLTIRGFRWGLREGLSPGAAANLAAAVKLVEGILLGYPS